MLYDLIVIGAELSGVSAADDARRAGVSKVLVLAREAQPPTMGLLTRLGLDIRLGVGEVSTGDGPDRTILVETETDCYQARACILIEQRSQIGRPAYSIPASLEKRVHFDVVDFAARDTDVLVVGAGERAVTLTLELVEAGARAVLSLIPGTGALSRLSRETLIGLEYRRQATILWHSQPDALEDVDGFPMAYFTDRRTPDLQFDHVIYSVPADEVDTSRPGAVGTSGSLPLVVVGSRSPHGSVDPARAWHLVRERAFPELDGRPELQQPAGMTPEEIDRLRLDHYNATITHFDRAHNELWVLRVEPDSQDVSHLPGQYATLGLGYWESRVDHADERLTTAGGRRMIRRSYSISSRIFDPRGYLVDPGAEREIEFYIVHVKPTGTEIPALTPRLAAKLVGDRIYLGPKIAGRYTLAPVNDPEMDVVFIATGTGEAPHNAMIADLLRRGHRGTILSSVTVRHVEDLAYAATYEELCTRFPSVSYLPIVTRGGDSPKRYVQDYVRSGHLEGLLPHGLDPAHTHVFLCGNPAMIGRPEWEDDLPVFPEPQGVSQLLHERGFTIDRRGVIGNLHQEEYW